MIGGFFMEKINKEISFKNNPITVLGKMSRIGDIGENFQAYNQEFEVVSLNDYNNKYKIISVVPSVDTPVCATQTRKFNEKASEFDEVVILNISVDLPYALKRFCAAEGINNAVTLSDYKDLDFAKKYGFLIKELRLLTRGVLIMDKKNRIKYVEYVREITNYPDFEKVLKELKKIIK